MQFAPGDLFNFKRDHIIAVEGLWQLKNIKSGKGFTDIRQTFVDEMSKISGVGDITECSDLQGK